MSSPSTPYNHRARNGVVPLGSLFVVLLSVLFSLLFIFSISLAFVGVADKNFFYKQLEALAKQSDGIVLLGESVDVDVDEPSVALRWSLVACGSQYMLPDSPPIHGSKSCGMPNMALQVFVDSSIDPVITYDPSSLPLDMRTGYRRIIQNNLQFDSDHVLDVHTTRLYPFDTYSLSTALRIGVPPPPRSSTGAQSSSATPSPSDAPPFLGLSIVQESVTFLVDTFDTPTSENVTSPVDLSPSAPPVTTPSRYVELLISRPAASRIYALLLFGINWLLSHFNFGVVLMTTFRGRLKRVGISGVGSGLGRADAAEKGEGKKVDAVRKIIEQRRAWRNKSTMAASTKTANEGDSEKPAASTIASPSPSSANYVYDRSRSISSKDSMKLLAGVLAVILVIPQLRNAMPDSPGFDGVLLDIIGFFPQMALAGASAIFLLLITVKRELDHSNASSVATLSSRSYQDGNDAGKGDAEDRFDEEDEVGFKLPSAFMSFGMPRGFHSRQLTGHSRQPTMSRF